MSDTNPVFENIKISCDLDSTFRLDEFKFFLGLDIDAHFHFMSEIMWFKTAQGTFSINNQKFTIKNNTLIYIPALSIHDMKLLECQDHKRFLLQFEESWLDELDVKLNPEMRLKSLVVYLDPTDADRLDTLLSWAYDYQKTDKPLYHSLLKSFLLFIVNRYSSNEYLSTQQIANANTQLLISLIQHLDKQRSYSITVSEAAKQCGWSESYFSRVFKSIFGVPFKDFILTRKLSIAVHLLSTTDLKIADIAYQSGFTDSAYFCARFRSVLGATPKQFRSNTSDTEGLVMR